ncbi:alcohol dehydrogenase [Rhodococcus sp. ABRD24]|uniref:zinc-dependent alcohol dehydrogenase n=1 Tax=Rhodococcus sp. ABRD24 TaxID=2507582 RepID=UPI001038C38A|nr:alcohol dehydrogenase catalytic domain-containing protein [Rhodococcus sp. ABRD24]QBJ98076.1 alcohol dehydrogenase [Rhodococcus sp. ABRD24]
MRAMFCDAEGSVRLTRVADPEILAPTDVILEITATTICGSDVHLVEGHIPTPWGFTVGHEYVGTVKELGDAVTLLEVGDRVVGPAAPWCSSCPTCRSGQTQRCSRGGVFGSGEAWGDLGGAQAEYLRVPWADHVLSKVPPTVTDAQALAVGDVLPTGWTAVRNTVHAPGGVVLVLGCGPVGLSAVHTAGLHGARQIIAVDTVPERLALAERLGATHTFVADATVADSIIELTGGRGVDSIIEAAGSPAALATAVACVALGGHIGIVGIHSAPVELDLAGLLFKNVSVWTGLGDLTHMDELLELIAAGRLDPSPMFTRQYSFDAIEQAYAEVADQAPGVVKTLITLP